jgi:type II secretory pathway pseudopilin PulG
MSILTTAKNKAASGSVKAAFTNEDGAIDLASIMVGIIVIGLIGGVIAATVFAVIPWAQDNAAKQQLDSVASAQSAYIGLSTDVSGSGTQQSFGGAAITATTTNGVTTYSLATGTARKTIVSGTGATANTLFDGTSKDVAVGNIGVGNGAHYGAAVQSDSGKVFYISDSKTQPTLLPATSDSKYPTAWLKTIVEAV